MPRRHIFFLGIGVALACLAAARIPAVAGFADFARTALFALEDEAPDPGIVIVALDEKTLNAKNAKRFQDISRADYAELLANIFKGSPRAVGVDVFFGQASADPADDRALARVAVAHKNLIFGEEFDFDDGLDAFEFLTPDPALGLDFSQIGFVNLVALTRAPGPMIDAAPVILQKNSAGGTAAHEPLALRVVRAASGFSPERPTFSLEKNGKIYAVEKDGAPALRIPIPGRAIAANFFGRAGSFPQISFGEVLAGAVDPEIFRDKIVLVGSTADDLHDEFLTPAGPAPMPGVEIHANLVQTILTRDFVVYAPWWARDLAVAGMVAIFVLAAIFGGGRGVAGVGIAAIGGYFFAAGWIFLEKGIIAGLVLPPAAGGLFWAGFAVLKMLHETRRRAEAEKLFGRFVAPEVVDFLTKNPAAARVGGEVREATIFFSDLADFTSISERMTVAELTEFLNFYLDRMTREILAERGTVDKFIGDAVMAFWNAPLRQADHAARAVRAALAQQRAVAAVNLEFEKLGIAERATVRMGLHTGPVTVGNFGAEARMDYTVIGDPVNLASRLESINKKYGTRVIASAATVRAAGPGWATRRLDRIRVKGKTEPVEIFEILGAAGEISDEKLAAVREFERGLGRYFEGKFLDAREIFTAIPDDPPAAIFARRAGELAAAPPADWDGVWVFDTK